MPLNVNLADKDDAIVQHRPDKSVAKPASVFVEFLQGFALGAGVLIMLFAAYQYMNVHGIDFPDMKSVINHWLIGR